ncbi:hypothetical protein Tco_0923391 [Tanacetum coccineum]|uniref:Uncharacterized protein n=1 Tax=Tanacetum coccineum TaxID=301880 RepID=A0ABQ5D3P5_9ASTR
MVEVPSTAAYNVFAVDTQHSEQPESINNTCVVEKVDSNVIPDSPDTCDNDIQTDQNAEACDDERVVLANLIANLKLNIDENKKIQKQLKKANASLTQELKECKSTLEVTNKTLGESNKLVDQAWEKHSHEHFRAPNAHDMEILIKTCLMPLALKTQNDTFKFVHEPKQEMHVDLKYIESLKKEIDELKYDKAEFSNMYDLLLQECVSNDVMCSYLHSLSDFDAYNELQSQLQDKNIAISELKKLIEKIKGKSVNTNFEKQSILKKLPLQPIRNQPVVHSCASAQKKDAQSHKTTKGYMLIEKKYDSKKHDRQIPIGQKFSPNKSFAVYMKTTPPRSGLIVKPTGRIFTQVGLKWIPIRKPVETRYNTNDSASPLGKETHNPKTVIWANSSSLSAEAKASDR